MPMGPVGVMTGKQRRLCMEYAKHGDKVKAALAAGYAKSYADKGVTRLFNAPAVKNFIESMDRRLRKKMALTREFKLKKLEIVIDRAIPDEYQEPMPGYEPKVGIAAIAESNKMQGHNGTAEDVTDEEALSAREILNKYVEQHKSEY